MDTSKQISLADLLGLARGRASVSVRRRALLLFERGRPIGSLELDRPADLLQRLRAGVQTGPPSARARSERRVRD